LTLAELDVIEVRAEMATEGPWEVPWPPKTLTTVSALQAEDAAFIAAARTDVPVLVAALRQAWATNAALNRRAQIAEAALNDLTREPVGGRKHRPVAAEVWQRCVESHGARCPAMAEERAYRARLIGALKACWKVDMRKAREAQAELDHIRSELDVQRYHAEHDPCDVCSHLEAVELGELIGRLAASEVERTAERDRARSVAVALEAEVERLRAGIEERVVGWSSYRTDPASLTAASCAESLRRLLTPPDAQEPAQEPRTGAGGPGVPDEGCEAVSGQQWAVVEAPLDGGE
jgi:hypothetical protein